MKSSSTNMQICSTLLFVLLCLSLRVQAQTLASYQATVLSQSPSNYFTFDGGSLTSVVGSPAVTLTASPVTVASQFNYDAFGNPNNAIYLTASSDTAYDPNEATDHLVSG